MDSECIYYTPTKHSDAQPLVEYEEQLPWEDNKKKSRECHAIAFGFLLLWHRLRAHKVFSLCHIYFSRNEHVPVRFWYTFIM